MVTLFKGLGEESKTTEDVIMPYKVTRVAVGASDLSFIDDCGMIHTVSAVNTIIPLDPET